MSLPTNADEIVEQDLPPAIVNTCGNPISGSQNHLLIRIAALIDDESSLLRFSSLITNHKSTIIMNGKIADPIVIGTAI